METNQRTPPGTAAAEEVLHNCRRQVEILAEGCVTATRVSFVVGGLTGLLCGVVLGNWLGRRKAAAP